MTGASRLRGLAGFAGSPASQLVVLEFPTALRSRVNSHDRLVGVDVDAALHVQQMVVGQEGLDGGHEWPPACRCVVMVFRKLRGEPTARNVVGQRRVQQSCACCVSGVIQKMTEDGVFPLLVLGRQKRLASLAIDCAVESPELVLHHLEVVFAAHGDPPEFRRGLRFGRRRRARCGAPSTQAPRQRCTQHLQFAHLYTFSQLQQMLGPSYSASAVKSTQIADPSRG